MGKTMIISVGGSISPVICSIKYHEPENIIFFASTETEGQVIEVLRQIELASVRRVENIITSSPEDINICLRALLARLPDLLSRWQVNQEEIIVDYTGGTKSMSSALVLGTITYTRCFSYIGGKERNKAGIGVVIDGKEKPLNLTNPWDELAVEEEKKVFLLFNAGRYMAAKEAIQAALDKVSAKQKPFLKTIQRLIEAYYLWDAFKYKNAKKELDRVKSELSMCISQLPDDHKLTNLLKKIEENIKFLLEIVLSGKVEEYELLDLLANAKRRGQVENRYDDAIVRIYRSLEKRGQIELKRYGLDASNIDEQKLPEGIRKEIKSKYLSDDKNRIKVPLYAAFQIIRAKEAEAGQRSIGHKFFDDYKNLIMPILDLRNSSIIVHGNNPLDKEKYEKAWQNCLKFLEVEENNLPEFPHLDLYILPQKIFWKYFYSG